MTGILVTIMVEVLSVLALATKQIRQGRFSKRLIGPIYISLIAKLGAEKFAKKLLGENEIEAVIQRLDRLTDDEARMTVAQTLQVVHGLINNVKVVMDGMQVLPARCQLAGIVWADGKASTSDIRQSLGMPGLELIFIMLTGDPSYDARDDERDKQNQALVLPYLRDSCCRYRVCMTGDQLQRDIRSWLSPPDPSTNHNIVCDSHRAGSSTWFTQDATFDEWRSTGSLLWIHGKRMSSLNPYPPSTADYHCAPTL